MAVSKKIFHGYKVFTHKISRKLRDDLKLNHKGCEPIINVFVSEIYDTFTNN